MNLKLQGVYTALVTPFDNQDQVCTKTLVSLLRHQEQAGVDAVVLMGTTGEPPTLEDDERDLLIATGVQELKGKVPLMIGCGSADTKKSVKMAVRAQLLGADCLQVVVPYYNKPTQEGLYYHFKAVAEAVEIPICVYNIPGRCAQNLEVNTLIRIAELPNIIGVKECSGNFQQITDIIEKICHKRSHFTMLSGDDPMTIPMMSVGAHGIMSVVSNLVPRTVVKMVRAMQSGNLALARALSYALKPLCQACFIETNPSPIKYLMQLAGMCKEYVRLPLCPVTRANQEKLREIFESCHNLLEDEISNIPVEARS